MPIYEFLCAECGKVIEAFQKLGDPPPRRCDECGGKKLSKLVSRSAFQLKGGGWYADLYSKKKGKAGGEKAPEGGTEGVAGAVPEKPAAPGEAAGAAKAGGAAKGEGAVAPKAEGGAPGKPAGASGRAPPRGRSGKA